MYLAWPQINSKIINSLRLHIKRIALTNFLESSVKKRIVFERSEFIRFSVTGGNSSNSFRVHASFRSFLTLRKEHIKSFLEFIPKQSGLRKEHLKIL